MDEVTLVWYPYIFCYKLISRDGKKAPFMKVLHLNRRIREQYDLYLLGKFFTDWAEFQGCRFTSITALEPVLALPEKEAYSFNFEKEAARAEAKEKLV
jgi:hypothetical protein